MTACTAVTRPLVVFLGALSPKARLCPNGRKVSPVLAHSALGGVAQEPKVNVLKACNNNINAIIIKLQFLQTKVLFTLIEEGYIFQIY